ncbi:MAG: lysophospholipid acyltransferase family protein [Chthoniobacteraceae bacterium]
MRWLAYRISCFLARCLLWPFVKIHVLEAAASARAGRGSWCRIHISHFDPPLLSLAACRAVDWMAMRELFANRFFATWLRAIGTFPADRGKADGAAVRTTLERLKQGRVVGIFPEGGIRDGEHSILQGAPMKPGALRLAQMAGVPIVPCVILGSDRLYNRRRWNPRHRAQVWIGFGSALEASAGPAALAGALQVLTRELREKFSLTDDDLPQPPQARMREP